MGMRVYIYGPRRSGLHPLAFWVLRHVYEGKNLEQFEREFRYANDIFGIKGVRFDNSRWDGTPHDRDVGPLQILGHEVVNPEDTADCLYHHRSSAYEDNRALILLRDPYNWLASLKRLGIFQGLSGDTVPFTSAAAG